MKILKVIGAVVGIHALALLLIFANPGCSSSTKPRPAPSDTVARTDAPPAVTVPADAPAISAAPPMNPDMLAISVPHYSPTRPETPAAKALEAKPVADVTPAVPYAVSSGDSLWTIAKKNHLTVAELAAANDLKVSAVLRPGQKLIIPSKALPAAATESPAKSTPVVSGKTSTDAVTHTVLADETLEGIAKKHGVPLRELLVANNIRDPNKVRAGQVLTIPGWQVPVSKGAKSTTAPAKTLPDSPLAPAPGTPPMLKLEDAPPAPK